MSLLEIEHHYHFSMSVRSEAIKEGMNCTCYNVIIYVFPFTIF